MLKAKLAMCLGALTLINSANAALHARPVGMVYDDVQDITWLSDMNIAASSGFAVDGRMTQAQAAAWAEQLTFGGVSDWRLPTLVSVNGLNSQYNTLGELSHLFITDLGNKPGESVYSQVGDTDVQKSNLLLFTNIRADTDLGYWATNVNVNGGLLAFRADVGAIGSLVSGSPLTLFATAVRDGDISAVPEPSMYALLLIGLAALGWCVNSRPNSTR